MEELKPCPFCGGDARVQKVNAIVGVKFTVCCGNCYCMSHETTYLVNTMEKAVEAWNRRSNECNRDELIKAADKLDQIAKNASTDNIGPFLQISNITPSSVKSVADRIRKALGVE